MAIDNKRMEVLIWLKNNSIVFHLFKIREMEYISEYITQREGKKRALQKSQERNVFEYFSGIV